MSLVAQSATQRTVLMGKQADALTESADYRVIGRPTATQDMLGDYSMLESMDQSKTYPVLKQQGRQEPQGTVEFEVTNWNHLYWVLGNIDTETDESSYFEHILKFDDPGNSKVMPYISAEFFYGARTTSNKLLGAMPERYTLSAAEGDMVYGSLDLIACHGVPNDTKGSVSTSSLDVFEFSQHTLELDSVTYDDVIKSVSLELSRNITRGPAWGNVYSQYLRPGPIVGYNLRLELDLPDWNLHTLLTGGTEFATTLTFSRGANDEAVFSFPKGRIFSLPEGYDEAITVSAPVELYGDLLVTTQDQITTYA